MKSYIPRILIRKGAKAAKVSLLQQPRLVGFASQTLSLASSPSPHKLVHFDLPARRLQLHHGSGASSVPSKLQPFAEEHRETCFAHSSHQVKRLLPPWDALSDCFHLEVNQASKAERQNYSSCNPKFSTAYQGHSGGGLKRSCRIIAKTQNPRNGQRTDNPTCKIPSEELDKRRTNPVLRWSNFSQKMYKLFNLVSNWKFSWKSSFKYLVLNRSNQRHCILRLNNAEHPRHSLLQHCPSASMKSTWCPSRKKGSSQYTVMSHNVNVNFGWM